MTQMQPASGGVAVSFDARPRWRRVPRGHEFTAPRRGRCRKTHGALPCCARRERPADAGLSGVLPGSGCSSRRCGSATPGMAAALVEHSLAQGEAHAVAVRCRSAWLDTFQARGFLPGARLSAIRHPRRLSPRSDPLRPVRAAGPRRWRRRPLDHLLMVRFAWCSTLTGRVRSVSIRWNQMPGTLLMPAHKPLAVWLLPTQSGPL